MACTDITEATVTMLGSVKHVSKNALKLTECVSAFLHFTLPDNQTYQRNMRKHSSSMRKLNVVYNDVMRMLLGLPRFQSASQTFMCCRVRDCRATIRNYIYKFIQRLDRPSKPTDTSSLC